MTRTCAVLLLIASAAAAEEPWPAFGKKGQVVPMGLASISRTSAGDSSITEVTIDPEILFFPADYFLVGIGATYRSLSSGSTTLKGWGASGHVGGSIDLGERVSLLLVSTVTYISQQQETTVLGTTATSTRNSAAVGASVPLLFHVAPHFFIGAGPEASVEFWASGSSERITTLRLQTIIGGWF